MNTLNQVYVAIIESFRLNILHGRDKLAIDRFGFLPGPKLKPRTRRFRLPRRFKQIRCPIEVVQRLSFPRSFGFIERRRAVPCWTCFRARRQLKASLCNERRSSGHWVCISLALPTVPLPLSLSLPRGAANRLKRLPKGSARVIALFLSCPLSLFFSLSFYRHRHHHRHPHRRITQGDRARLVQADSRESRRSTGTVLYATIESSILRIVLRPNSCRICNGRLVIGARFLPLRNTTLWNRHWSTNCNLRITNAEIWFTSLLRDSCAVLRIILEKLYWEFFFLSLLNCCRVWLLPCPLVN